MNLNSIAKFFGLLSGGVALAERLLPVAKKVAEATTKIKWDDKLVGGIEKALAFSKEALGDDSARRAAAAGIKAFVRGRELGLTDDEIEKAIEDGITLEEKALSLKKAIRSELVEGRSVQIGDLTLTTKADLKNVPRSTLRLSAEAFYNLQKTNLDPENQ